MRGIISIAAEKTTEDKLMEVVLEAGAEDLPFVFDRFWRGDASRQAAVQHCGLGLSLCKTLTELLRGTIRADLIDGGRFRISIALPLASSPN